MSDKVAVLEDRILQFIQQSLDELNSIRKEEASRLEKARSRITAMSIELKELASGIDSASREYSALREKLVLYSKQGLIAEEKEAYDRASESMKLHALLEERYRNLTQRRDELQKEERALSRVVSKSESMGTRLRMVMNLVALPEAMPAAQAAEIVNDGALVTAFQIAEREARSFAQELHDGPTQSFSALGLTLEMAQELMSRGEYTEATGELKLALSQLRGGLSEVRSLLFGLSPTGIDMGFEVPLKRLADQVKRSWGTELTWKLTGKLEEVPLLQRGNVFKTVHQAVVNAAKSGAPHVKVTIGNSRRTVRGLIIDDGKGFDVEKERSAARERGSYGLQNMEERVTVQGGEFAVSSVIGKGTTISFKVPLRTGEGE